MHVCRHAASATRMSLDHQGVIGMMIHTPTRPLHQCVHTGPALSARQPVRLTHCRVCWPTPEFFSHACVNTRGAGNTRYVDAPFVYTVCHVFTKARLGVNIARSFVVSLEPAFGARPRSMHFMFSFSHSVNQSIHPKCPATRA